MLTSLNDPLGGLDPSALFKPVTTEKKIGLAISGGPDSLALMLLYAAWREHANAPQAIVYTLDHGLRPEAAEEAEYVRRLAVERGLDMRVLKWQGDKPKSGISVAARVARYRLIGAQMEKDGVSVLLTAHHLNDQAETVLMRLAHGSGAKGLGGMRPFSDVEGVRVFRPLLGVTKYKLGEIVSAHGLDAAQDPSNGDLNYERARWRAMAPGLEQAGLSAERLAQFAERMARLDTLATQIAEDVWHSDVRVDDFGVIHIAEGVFSSVPEEAGLRVLWRALRRAGSGQRGDLAGVEALYRKLAKGQVDTGVTLMGAVVVPGPQNVLVYREAGRQGLPSGRAAAGSVTIWDGRFTVQAPIEVTIASAKEMTRQLYSELTGDAPEVPVAALRAAPLVRDEAGTILALGARIFDPRVRVGHVALT